MMRLDWTGGSRGMTWLRGYFRVPELSFEETVARLAGLSGQTPAALADGDKTSVEFEGTFDGQPFTLYDYKGGSGLHVGGSDDLDLHGLLGALTTAVRAAQPVPYMAVVPQEWGGHPHHWPTN